VHQDREGPSADMAARFAEAVGAVSDRRAWLDQWCPQCSAAPGARCRQSEYGSPNRPSQAQALHIARGWRERACPTCKALSEEPCCTPSGREASQPHTARLRAGRRELATRQAVWEDLQRRGAMVAVVPFSGRAGRGGATGAVTLSHLEGQDLVDAERCRGRDELALALEGPVWDRYASFAGHPWIRGTVTWTLAERCIVIAGQRGGEAFKEVLA
jgi:hypothetical protein